MTSVNFTNEMSVFTSISTGGEGKLRHKWWGRDLLCLSCGKVTSCAGKWIQSFYILVHSSIHQALPPYGRRAVCCCCSSHALLVFADLLDFILPALNFLSDFRCFLFCCSARHFFLHEEPCILPFISCPPVSLILLIIQALFWFLKCPASVTEVFCRPCLSRDVPLCTCHTNAGLHRGSGSGQMQAITVSLQLLHFGILSQVFLLPWVLTLKGLGLGSVQNCLD